MKQKKVKIPTYSTFQKIVVLENNITLGKKQEAIKSLKALKMDFKLGIFEKTQEVKEKFDNILPDLVDFFRGDLEIECIISTIKNELTEEEEKKE